MLAAPAIARSRHFRPTDETPQGIAHTTIRHADVAQLVEHPTFSREAAGAAHSSTGKGEEFDASRFESCRQLQAALPHRPSSSVPSRRTMNIRGSALTQNATMTREGSPNVRGGACATLPRGLTCRFATGHKGACKPRTKCPVCNGPVKFVEGDKYTYLACAKGHAWLDMNERRRGGAR